MSRPFKEVLIVGAGPSGLLLALLLAKHGIPVHILEAAAELDQQPRAAHYGAPAAIEFARAGILDEVRKRGLTVDVMSWRRLGSEAEGDKESHPVLRRLDGRLLADVEGTNPWTRDLRTTGFMLQDLDALMLDLVVGKYGGRVSWEHRVVRVGQDAESGRAWCDVVTRAADGGEVEKRIEADYVVGCDGANSAVRKSLFGEEFPGFTWDAQIIATNTYYDFEKYGFDETNYIMHPDHFCLVGKITNDGLYRVTYGETPGLTHEEYVARQPQMFELLLPGHPKPDAYKIVNLAPYKMHQRCAPAFRVGRVMLAADAAHLCNPWGGLGITGGFVDVGGLYDCLAGIWDGLADESILDLYSARRIEKWRAVIDAVSQESFRRMRDPDIEARLASDVFLNLCAQAEEDEELRRKLLLAQLDVRYDFTQHYHRKEAPANWA